VNPVCLPQCNSDADCGGDLFCDPSDGLCRTTQKTGKGIGEPCTPPGEGGTDECRGRCVSFIAESGGAPLTSMCAENCTAGSLPSCGWAGPSQGTADAYCLFTSTVVADRGGAGLGDLGSCGQLCNCNGDCLNPELICVSLENADFERALGRPGYCSLPEGGNTGIPCN